MEEQRMSVIVIIAGRVLIVVEQPTIVFMSHHNGYGKIANHLVFAAPIQIVLQDKYVIHQIIDV
ncbi:MAG: hypothetical protein QXS37_04430 [Candidatus Aenigmatarchaeota archaeon]